MASRRNHYDVTNTVRISHPQDVCTVVKAVLAETYPGARLDSVDLGFRTFQQLYAGTLPGYLGCDTWYHDAQHSLDCALAMARLIHGHERSQPESERLGAHRGILGVITALFHDAGYIRRDADTARNGAEFTVGHVRRSGDFLGDFLPLAGYAGAAPLTQQLVHFTGYEVALDQIQVHGAKDRMLGFLLGTADVLAQTADRCYLEKCRDFLYREFEICGMAGDGARALYHSPQELLEKTPDFNRKLWQERLDGYFEGCHRYYERHFSSGNLYAQAVHGHMDRITDINRRRSYDELRLRPRSIGATELRQQG